MAAQGSVLTNKYAEGYPGRRYYGGCVNVDVVETLAIERLKQLFSVGYANVQPHSGAQANLSAFMALLKPGDTILGMGLAAGGHLSHGAAFNISGSWFNAISYEVRRHDHIIDYEQVEQLAYQHRPKMIIAGGSSYSRIIDFERFRNVADSVGAYLMVDMAHFAGLVAGGVYPNPCAVADVVTSTTHKTLRGPRGGIIMTNSEDIIKKINSAVFPGVQGGPLMHVIAGKAVAFAEALRPEFKEYARQIVENAQVFVRELQNFGCGIVSGGTDSHLLLVDLRALGVSGLDAEIALEQAGITCNKNSIPFDPVSPRVTSGIRIGTPAVTTRGFKEPEIVFTANIISQVLTELKSQVNLEPEARWQETPLRQRLRAQVREVCSRYPLYT